MSGMDEMQRLFPLTRPHNQASLAKIVEHVHQRLLAAEHRATWGVVSVQFAIHDGDAKLLKFGHEKWLKLDSSDPTKK